MKRTEENSVLVILKGKDACFKARIPLWKAYLILSDIEKEELRLKKLKMESYKNELIK